MRLGATTIIIKDDQVLLVKREDFRVWVLPGGRVEPNETTEAAAIRETYEETGYHVELEGMMGKFHVPQLNEMNYVYWGHVVGGKTLAHTPESVAIDWFPMNELPRNLRGNSTYYLEVAQERYPVPVQQVILLSSWWVFGFKTLIALRDMRNTVFGFGS